MIHFFSGEEIRSNIFTTPSNDPRGQFGVVESLKVDVSNLLGTQNPQGHVETTKKSPGPNSRPYEGKPMVSPLTRPAKFLGGKGGIGGVPLDSHGWGQFFFVKLSGLEVVHHL